MFRFWLLSGSPDDVLAIYASKPVSRIVGLVEAKDKLAEETALWPDERF